MARSLRLAVIRNVFEQGLLSEEDAKEILSGPLAPDQPMTVFDDSEWLTKEFPVDGEGMTDPSELTWEPGTEWPDDAKAVW